MASTYLQRTGISAGNRRIWTFSAWVKRSGLGEQRIFNHELSSGTAQISVFKWDGSNKILYADSVGSGNSINLNSSNMVFRDVNAWYHLVLRVDTTDATANNRARIYVNGQDIHSELGGFSTHTQPSQNYDTFANQSGNKITIGAWVNNTTQYFDGSMSHIHYCDGYSYAPTEFGETDSTTGEWKIKTSPSVSYGTNGFFILKDGNSVTDQSGNTNNFTVGGGTLTDTEDNPSNVFCTFNPLIPQGLAYANGNLSATHNAASWKTAYGTLAMSGTGKYYFESKVSTLGSYQGVGIVDAEQISSSAQMFADNSRGYAYKSPGELENNNAEPATFNSYTTGDIIMTAVDLNAGAIWYGKNGTWENSATQSEIEAGTTTNAAFTGVSNAYVYLPAVAIFGSGTNQINFGNGFFGSTAISSEGTNASGIGKFEYDVPNNFTAISTKGLNE